MALRFFRHVRKINKHQASMINLYSTSVVCNASSTTLTSRISSKPDTKFPQCSVHGSTFHVRNYSSCPSGTCQLAYDALEGDPGHTTSPIIILHGLFGSKNNWSSLAKKMNLELGRKVVAVDARNHGSSEHGDDMSYEAMSRDTVHLIKNELKVEKCTLIGHSMGGKTAMYTALTQPSVVDSLLIVDIAPCDSEMSGSIEQYMTTLMKIEFDNNLSLSQMRRNVANQMLKIIPDENLRYFMVTNLVKDDGQFRWRINLKSILENKDNLAGFPAMSQPYNGMTEFVGGSQSEYIGGRTLPEIRRLFPEAIIRTISGAGHWVHAEKPQEFLEIVRPFLTD